MKRGGRLQRTTPLRARKPMKRTRIRHSPTRKPGGPFWAKQRAALLERSGHVCERCGQGVTFESFQAHHRKLRSQGGLHGLENLVALCEADHAWLHAHPETAMALGFIVPAAFDPAVRAVRLHDRRWVRLTSDGAYDEVFDVRRRDDRMTPPTPVRPQVGASTSTTTEETR